MLCDCPNCQVFRNKECECKPGDDFIEATKTMEFVCTCQCHKSVCRGCKVCNLTPTSEGCDKSHNCRCEGFYHEWKNHRGKPQPAPEIDQRANCAKPYLHDAKTCRCNKPEKCDCGMPKEKNAHWANCAVIKPSDPVEEKIKDLLDAYRIVPLPGLEDRLRELVALARKA